VSRGNRVGLPSNLRQKGHDLVPHGLTMLVHITIWISDDIRINPTHLLVF
jgi:hypothetical protein